jgi:hypothetical protein
VTSSYKSSSQNYSDMATRDTPHSKTKPFLETAITLKPLEDQQRSPADVKRYVVIADNIREAEGQLLTVAEGLALLGVFAQYLLRQFEGTF